MTRIDIAEIGIVNFTTIGTTDTGNVNTVIALDMTIVVIIAAIAISTGVTMRSTVPIIGMAQAIITTAAPTALTMRIDEFSRTSHTGVRRCVLLDS